MWTLVNFVGSSFLIMKAPGAEDVNYGVCGILAKMAELGWVSVDGIAPPEVERVGLESQVVGTLAILDLIQRRCPVGREIPRAESASDQVVFEYELEKERRIVVSVDEGVLDKREKWDNRFVDTYDSSGRFRIREKNGKLRESVKIPLFYDIDPIMKHCIRIELKPITETQHDTLVDIRNQLRRELGTQEFRKYGKKIKLTSGQDAWINTDDAGQFWIECDEDVQEERIEDYLPEGIHYVRDEVSKVEIHQNAIMEKYHHTFLGNLMKTSRIASGTVDVSVSLAKATVMRESDDAQIIVEANERSLFDFLWKNKLRHFDNPISVLSFIDDIASVVNSNLVETPNAWRTWDVTYGRKIKVEDLGEEMMIFASDFVSKYNKLNDENDFVEFAGWLELQVDRHLHPYVDGCGRIAKSLSTWLLMSRGLPLPNYVDRKLYYGAMNDGDQAFNEYFWHAYEKGREEWMIS